MYPKIIGKIFGNNINNSVYLLYQLKTKPHEHTNNRLKDIHSKLP